VRATSKGPEKIRQSTAWGFGKRFIIRSTEDGFWVKKVGGCFSSVAAVWWFLVWFWAFFAVA
jgi:hypothetical protein